MAVGIAARGEQPDQIPLPGEPGERTRLDRGEIGGDQLHAGGRDKHAAQAVAHHAHRRTIEGIDPPGLFPLPDGGDRGFRIDDDARPRQILELDAFAAPTTRAGAMIEQVVAQSAVATGAGTERLELGRAAPRRFCANLQDPAHVVRQIRTEQLGDGRLVDTVRLDPTRAQPRQQAPRLGGRLDHTAGEPSHLGVELRLSFRDQRLGSLDQLEVDRDPALVDPGVEQEDLALSIGQRTQSPMERSLYLDVLPAVGDQPRDLVRDVPPDDPAVRLDQARARHLQHQPVAGDVLLRRQAQHPGRFLQASGQRHGGGKRAGAVPLLERRLRPAVPRRQDMAPDHALEGHRVVRNERMAGSHMLDQLSRRRIAGTPGLNGAIADRPAGAPQVGARVLGVDGWSDALEVDGRAGLDIQVKEVGHRSAPVLPACPDPPQASRSSTSAAPRSIASNSSSGRRRPSMRSPSRSFCRLCSANETPLEPLVS